MNELEPESPSTLISQFKRLLTTKLEFNIPTPPNSQIHKFTNPQSQTITHEKKSRLTHDSPIPESTALILKGRHLILKAYEKVFFII